MLRQFIACSLILVAPMAASEGLLLDGIDLAQTTSHLRPARGTTMERVQAEFGAPALELGTVGEPPITRWEYPGFAVYFEHNLVIHAIATP